MENHLMKRLLATLAISTMMVAAPTAAFASGGDTTSPCGGTCEGDTDGHDEARYECRNAAGGFIVVNAANCTNIFFPILTIVDL